MNPIGFTAKIHNVEQTTSMLKSTSETNKLITFDSGNYLTFDDACHHILVLGTTGSGKTTSAILPMLAKLFSAGQGGLIIDVKGNLRNHIRALGKSCNREKDIEEFGTATSAKATNILRGLSMMEVHEFFVSILQTLFEGKTGNMDFHMRGVAQATTCVEFLLILEQVLGKKVLSLEFVNQFLDMPIIASKLYLAYKNILYDKNDLVQKAFVERIEASQFSIFHYANEQSHLRSYHEQCMYEISSARTAISNFIKTPGIIHGFCDANAPALNMSQYLQERKIVVLRFGPDTGNIGVGLARKLIQDYYQHIYDLGTEKAQKKPSFICLDEFQDVALHDGSRFADSQFISQAREFKATFIASTQSVAALNCRNNSSNMVNSFVSNCNNRILFYSDDPETQELAKRSAVAPDLNTLQPGEAFVDLYCTDTRTHNQSMEMFNRVYSEIQKIVKKHPMKITKTAKNQPDTKTMQNVLGKIKEIEVEKERKAEEIKLAAKKEELKNQDTKSSNSSTGFEVLEENLAVGGQDTKVNSENPSEYFEFLCEHNRLYQNYLHYFVDPSDMLIIPEGWTDFICNVFDALKENNYNPKIVEIRFSNQGSLYMDTDYHTKKNPYEGERAYLEKTMLNTLLRHSKYICPMCGSKISTIPTEEYRDSKLNICQECLDKYNIDTPKKKNSVEGGFNLGSNVETARGKT